MSPPVPSGLIQGVSVGTEERWQLERAGFEGGPTAAVLGFRCAHGMCSEMVLFPSLPASSSSSVFFFVLERGGMLSDEV